MRSKSARWAIATIAIRTSPESMRRVSTTPSISIASVRRYPLVVVASVAHPDDHRFVDTCLAVL
jgi:hypothetical protein